MTASQNLAVVYLAGAVKRFRERHPKVDIELDVQDSITNIIEGGYDIAFRIGWLKSTELHAVKICDFEMIPCASPGLSQDVRPDPLAAGSHPASRGSRSPSCRTSTA